MELKQVSISVLALYEKFGGKLTHGTIAKMVDVKTKTEYYELYLGNELACREGEVCDLVHYGKGLFTLKSENSENGSSIFILTDDEFNVAYFK